MFDRATVCGEVVCRNADRFAALERLDVAHEQIRVQRIRVVEIILQEVIVVMLMGGDSGSGSGDGGSSSGGNTVCGAVTI